MLAASAVSIGLIGVADRSTLPPLARSPPSQVTPR